MDRWIDQELEVELWAQELTGRENVFGTFSMQSSAFDITLCCQYTSTRYANFQKEAFPLNPDTSPSHKRKAILEKFSFYPMHATQAKVKNSK